MVKINYYYGKAREDVEKWLAEINQIIKTNNMIVERKITVVAAYLRDIAANWYKVNKNNIIQYADEVEGSFIKWIKVRFISDV